MAAPPDGEVLLRVSDVSKTFGGIAAVSGVSMVVGRGESVGLVGPNGAGKTTLFNCVCGQLRPERGAIELDGRLLNGMPTFQRARLGIGRTYQRVEVFPDMSVRDHLLVASRARWRQGRLWRDLCNLSRPTAQESDALTTYWTWWACPTAPTPPSPPSASDRAGSWNWPVL